MYVCVYIYIYYFSDFFPHIGYYKILSIVSYAYIQWVLVLYFALLNFFVEVYLVYSIVLISAVQQSESVRHNSFSYSFRLWFIPGY